MYFTVLHTSFGRGLPSSRNYAYLERSGAETLGGAERKKNFLFLMSYLMFKFPLDLALWGAKLEFFQQDPF
jgi:hypothetical protein